MKNILNNGQRENGKYPEVYASSAIGAGAMENILNYGRRENVKISSTICLGKMENIHNYMLPQLWAQGQWKMSSTLGKLEKSSTKGVGKTEIMSLEYKVYE
jgi:hypothetical protein